MNRNDLADLSAISPDEIARECAIRNIGKKELVEIVKKAYAAECLLPHVGSIWIWEPEEPHARVEVMVTRVSWNGESWWVETEADGRKSLNELSRFIEACVLKEGCD